MRRAAKRDAVEAAIVLALHQCGCRTKKLSQEDVPDLLVKKPDGSIHIVECKDRRGTLTPGQRRFIEAWGEVPLLRTAEEAVRWATGTG